MRLNGKESLLVLKSPDTGSKHVEIAGSLKELLPTWSGRDRISPIFEIEDGRPERAFNFKPGPGYLFFIGPINPARAEGCLPILKGKDDRAWLSFGLFNLVLYTRLRGAERALISWANAKGVRWEKWDLNGTEIKEDLHSHISRATPTELLKTLTQFRLKASRPELRDAGEEYCALLAAAACRSMDVDPQLTDELEQANAIILQSARAQLSRPGNGGELSAIALLVDANAALSRFTSQMFSGIPPIKESECHFWTHSLLGTGVANLALIKIRRFITLTLGEARIPDQIKILHELTDETLIKEVLEDSPSLWSGPWLQRLPEITGRAPLLRELDPLAPLFTYVSGRDGYHTTHTSLSAPLNILTSCSSLRWSLLTITHEMSHRVIDEVLGYILPDPRNPSEVSSAVRAFNSDKPANLLAALQFKVLNVMAQLNATAPLISFPDSPAEKDILDLMGTRREEVEEIMVHVFDFLYFYGADPEVYVPAIWRSWDAIPSLHRRLPGYVLRTLCAVFAKFWSSSTPTQDTLAAVKAGMDKVLKLDKNNAYIQDAITFLSDHTDSLQKQLWARRTLVGIVRTFLQSPVIVQSVRGQSSKTTGSRSTPFNGAPIENPLRFIEANTSTLSSAPKSLWMLARLAFDTSDPHPLRIKDIHHE